MPPKVKYAKEDVISAALELLREKGEQALNARAIAKRLGCSTQPLYRELKNMDELYAELMQKAAQVYRGYIERSAASPYPPYKATGMAYLRFAHEEKALFRLLFMRSRAATGFDSAAEPVDPSMQYILDALSRTSGATGEELNELHLHMFIFAHGLAVMLATDYIEYDEERFSALMSRQFSAYNDARRGTGHK